jgi:NAD(P)-dependent dehydrogenase (short-subunit alcohol dehydrogenase family)
MASTAPVAFILGAGPNIGAAVGKFFRQKGYQVALASRRLANGKGSDGTFNVQLDLSEPQSVPKAFQEVTSALGAPAVVVYNGAAATFVSGQTPLELADNLSSVQREININITSALVAAREATKGFDTLPGSAARTFIYTGNITNTEPITPLLSNSIGKAAAANIIHTASIAYADKGFKYAHPLFVFSSHATC